MSLASVLVIDANCFSVAGVDFVALMLLNSFPVFSRVALKQR